MARITRMSKLRLGELLQAAGLVTEEQVRIGLEEQRKSNLFLGEALVKLGFVTEEAIAQTIVQQFNLPFVAASQFNIASEVFNQFPERMYYEYQFVAVDKLANVITIVAAGLMNHDVLDELERISGCRVCQFVSTWKDIRTVVQRYSRENDQKAELTSLGTILLNSGEFPKLDAKSPPPVAVTSAVAQGKGGDGAATVNLKPLGVISSAFLAAINGPAKARPSATAGLSSSVAALVGKPPVAQPAAAPAMANKSSVSLSAFKAVSGQPGGTPPKGSTVTAPAPRLTAFMADGKEKPEARSQKREARKEKPEA